jgi:DNA-binding beta-propeller fold protein YncE
MTLPRGLAASQVHGRPVSAKFEMPDGDLWLSVYIAAADGFVEMALDPKTGTVISAEPITDADDLTHANAQKAAMEKATVLLQAAAEKAVDKNPYSQAISVVPERRNGRPVAAVKLLRPRDLNHCHGAIELTPCRATMAGPWAKRQPPWALSPCILAFIMLLTAAAGAAEPEALTLETTIPLLDVRGRIDHMAIDRARQRLIVAALGNNTVEVADLATGKPFRRLRGLSEPQGVAYADKADLIFVANAGDDSVRIFRAADLTALGRSERHEDADNMRIDPRNRNIVVGYGNGGLAIIDPMRRAEIGTIPLQGHPEGFQIEPTTGRAFVNVPDAEQIAVVDLDERRQTATWKCADASGNFPMALHPTRDVLATVFRSPPRLVLLDTRAGTVTGILAACRDADDVFFDAKRERIYVSCGAGEIAVFQREGGTYRRLASIATPTGARTSLFVPELDRLFVAVRAGLLGSDASIQVFRPTP